MVLVTGQSESYAVAVDSEHVYWIETNAARSLRAQLDGGDVRIIAAQRSQPYLIAIDGVNAYWLETYLNAPAGTGVDGGAIVRVSLDGGTPVILSSYPSLINVHGLATDGTNVFWTVYGSSDSERYPDVRLGGRRGHGDDCAGPALPLRSGR